MKNKNLIKRVIKNNLVFSAFKKSFLVHEIQVLRNTNYIKNVYLYNYRKKRNLCLYTSRSRALLSLTRSSRHYFRVLAKAGRLQGVRRVSW